MDQSSTAVATSEELERYWASRLLSWLFVLAFPLLIGAARSIYSSQGFEPSGRFEFLHAAGWMFLLWYWLKEQCRPYRAEFPFDFGLFLLLAWFILAPYYLWHYERWRGLAKVAGVAAVLFVSHLVALAVHYLMVW